MKIETAPMAGYTDWAFRRTLVKCGARVVWTEMVSVAALFFSLGKNKDSKAALKTLELLKFDKKKGVKNVVQLFGKVPEHFEFVIKSGVLNGFDEININMGCPAPKIFKNGEGAALVQKPELVREIVKACVKAAKGVPVSVKMRLDNVSEIANICAESGASRLIIHGRFAKQGYSGKADWNAIAEIVKLLPIVLIVANGDIRNRDDAMRCLDITGASGVMMGRALIGSPWAIAGQGCSKSYIKRVIKYHLKQAKKCKTNPNEMKKHVLLYRRYFPKLCTQYIGEKM